MSVIRMADVPRAAARVIEGPIERIVVLRALMLGDMLCAVPALRALRRGFPQAQISLVALPWARSLVQRLSCVDRFIEFPGYPGLPERSVDAAALPDFLAHIQARRYDLALQLHGSGRIVNPLVSSFGARQTAGFHGPEAWFPTRESQRYLPWPGQGHEIERLLALVEHLGLARCGTALEFPVNGQDREELLEAWRRAAGDDGPEPQRPYVVVHAGAQLPSRRWPPQRFAQLARWIAAAGRTVVLTGTAREEPLVNAVAAAMPCKSLNLAGRTSLWMLGALVQGAECVVCNDTGISHIAAALRRPSVVVSSGSDVSRWAPLVRSRHQVLWSDMTCRPCGHEICPFDEHPCASAIQVEEVMRAVSRIIGPRSRASSTPLVRPAHVEPGAPHV
jgi:lipopolysaccharide heptosyltransferase II